MPSKIMTNSIFEKNRNREWPSNLEPNIHISKLGPSHVTKFGRHVSVYVCLQKL